MIAAKHNPFSTNRVLAQRYRLSDCEWDDLMLRLREAGFRGAIVGPHGSGKTTLLEDLVARLRADGFAICFLRFSTEDRHVWRRVSGWDSAAINHRVLVVVDGAEQLGTFVWLWLRWKSRNAAGLVITTHNPGRLRTLFRCTTRPSIIQDLASALGWPLSRQEAEALFVRHQGNVREALRDLYDLAAEASSECALP
jgi:hypothetical protein